MRTPILLVGFNRPDYLQQVFNQIKKYKPQCLYIAIDGPRPDVKDDVEKCAECRNIVNQVDWECDLHTLLRAENLGCGYGMRDAISWAFKNEERLIILEDDCVPSMSFFQFCEMMLEKYKDDTRVWQVSGRCYHPDSIFFEHSDYIFSHFPHVWGWATWRRCWNQYDFSMSDFPQYHMMGGAVNTTLSSKLAKRENIFFLKIFNEIKMNPSYHTWDNQWSYLMSKNNAYSIVPHKNLIHNIGMVGTHTSKYQKPDIPSEEMSLDLRHPDFVFPNKAYDIYHGLKVVYHKTWLIKRAVSKIKRMILATVNASH